ncbi:MAG: RDD family protein [Dehalococcoidia bacterium]|nr:RDD family protein [Dehalococcoidia bacterium]
MTPDPSSTEPRRSGAPGIRWQGDGALRRTPPPAAAVAPAPGTVFAGARPFLLATVRRRAAGLCIDTFVKLVLIQFVLTVGGVTEIADPISPSLLIAGQLLSRGYDWIFFTRGWTPGLRLLGMRIVRAESGEEPGQTRALVRVLGCLLSETAFALGYAWALWDRRRQTWQDKLASTYVVMAPPEERG